MQKRCDTRHAAVSRLRRMRFVSLFRNCALTTVRATWAEVSAWQSPAIDHRSSPCCRPDWLDFEATAEPHQFMSAAAEAADTPHRRGTMHAQTLETRGVGFGIRVRTLRWTCATAGLARDHRRDRKHSAAGFQCSRRRFSRRTGRHLEALRSNPQSDRLSRVALRRRDCAGAPAG